MSNDQSGPRLRFDQQRFAQEVAQEIAADLGRKHAGTQTAGVNAEQFLQSGAENQMYAPTGAGPQQYTPTAQSANYLPEGFSFAPAGVQNQQYYDAAEESEFASQQPE